MATKVFINYAKEDSDSALRLFEDLNSYGLDAWLDQVKLLPGQNWKNEIYNAIRDCRYFIALISNNSIKKKGFVQKEIKDALLNQEEFPESETYLIPVRLHECKPEIRAITELHWVDLFPSWDAGLNKILKAIETDIPIATQSTKDKEEFMVYELAFLWHGKEPPSIPEHWGLLTPHILFTKDFLHKSIESGKLKITKEIRFPDGVTKFVSKEELRRFAKEIGETPAFLRNE
ncbi:MAG: toll/interleukin-1 receptor domain-containing protein [Balneolaceae bacterium]|nr:toll/interleukin-1 receptor domain-containing protein [Balneolaceae bacterium]MBO6547431.1 toll/interleukin-1 receptor domain-containing protein [Balneolaceae bacterium]MBO6647622.1 toll/interleukin-1 receptor domain-containing protein [Balneolaceae bacterium]